MTKKTGKSIPKQKIKEEQNYFSVRTNKKEAKIIGLVSGEIEENINALMMNPYVALKYFQSDWQCFSEWNQQELKEFSSFLNDLKKRTWQQVYKTGSNIPKHGLGYTKYHISDIKSDGIKEKLKAVASELSEDIDFFELRVNQNKLRVHGFQSQSIFFLVLLDRNHEAFPM